MFINTGEIEMLLSNCVHLKVHSHTDIHKLTHKVRANDSTTKSERRGRTIRECQ